MLSTLAREPQGYPFGSVVLFALDGEARPLLLVSTLAEHTKNLAADARCSLLVVETAASGERLARGRLTLVGRAERVPDGDLADARARYLARHAEAEQYLALPDFQFWRIAVESVRYVGGFGRMSWVDVDAWRNASP